MPITGPRVLMDVTAVPADRRGVGRYVDSLLPALTRCDVSMSAVCRRRDAEHYRSLGVEVITAPAFVDRRPLRLGWEQVGLPAAIRRHGADLLHSPHYTLPLAAPVPSVVTLHDATFFTRPEGHTAVKARFFRAATRLALRRAAACLVPSQATADELVRVAGADPSRLRVVHHGVDLNRFAPPSPAAVAALRDRLGLGRRYVAFLGTVEPRKNIPALVRGWVRACADDDDPPALVVAGGTGWGPGLDEVRADVPDRLRFIRPGYLPLADVPTLLGGADVVAYPSLDEGFGLPVLEGMACGAAVLTTRRGALPEVGGDAVAYTEPGAQSIGDALRSLLADPGRRRALGEAGRRRAAGFSWTAAAEAHVAAYDDVLRDRAAS